MQKKQNFKTPLCWRQTLQVLNFTKYGDCHKQMNDSTYKESICSKKLPMNQAVCL
jgi:hypothetical protein